ncbi:MAG: tetratricopeptide repeat protein [Myxococcales bacterium]|nr:tetratricopeptide repeat protein [Myxococcales bacterium]
MTASEYSLLCPACCAENPGDKRFCGDCGAELDHGPLELVDEIRTATVLFADVARFTELSAQLGLEAIKLLMDHVFDRLYQEVLRHGGVVDKYIGDCVMALFGAPIAYGDDAARAVRAGLAFQRALNEMRPELLDLGLPPIDMRVGINSGPVIAGAVGAGPQRRYTVMGHTVNVASHLQQDAPIGAVVIGDGTFRRVRGLFELARLEGGEHSGHVVAGERFGGLWLRPREILGAEVEMVGRVEELSHMQQLMHRCHEERRAQLLVVSGPPGIGKTRLGAEFLTWLELRYSEAVRLVAFADPQVTASPFGVAADALTRKLSSSDSRGEIGVDALMSMARNVGCTVADGDRAVLARLVGLPSSLVHTRGEKPPSHGHFAQRCMDLLEELAERVAELTTIVVFIEDMHWCDAATLELCERLMQRARDKPIFIVGFARPELLRERPELVEGVDRHVIELEALHGDDVGELLERVLGPDLRPRLEALCSSALGNPFHVEELLRTLEERGVLVRQVNGWTLGAVPDDFGIPPGVEAVTQVRIDNLDPSQRALLRSAAAIGPTFWDGALRELASDFSPKDLSTLVRRELVVPMQESQIPGQREFRFLHEMTRQVAYAMIPESQRPPLHLRVAQWLDREQAGTTNAEELAAIGSHFDLGGDKQRAADYLGRAGDVAYERGAYDAALDHFTRAVELAQRDDVLFDVLARRERVHNALGRWALQLADAEHLIELAVDRDRRRVEALLRLGRAHLNRGEHARARSAFDEALEIASELDDTEGRARALRWIGMVHFNRSEHREALPSFSEALVLAEKAGLDGLAAELAYEYGVTAGTIGDYGRAVDVSRRALEMFRRQGNRYQESFCLGNLGCFHIYLGEYERAVAVLEQAAALGRRMGIPLAEASAEANLGNALRFLGRFDEALRLEARAGAVAQRLGDVRLEADTCLYGALAALGANTAMGDRLDAASLAREALSLARQAEMPGTEAAASMALAQALAAAGKLDEALGASARAVQILDALGSVEGFEADIRLTHARLCLSAGRRAEAYAILERARSELEQMAEQIDGSERRRRFLLMVESNAAIFRLSGARS